MALVFVATVSLAAASGPNIKEAGLGPNSLYMPKLSYQSNSVLYNTSDIITATCSPSSDNCAIWYSGIQLANAIGKVTYNAKLLAPGTYNVYANDITTGVSGAVAPLVVLPPSPVYPNQRFGGVMVYDAADGYYLLFSGATGEGDTWVYENSTWAKLDLTIAPHQRTDACMVYDPAQKQVILFGGLTGYNPDTYYLNDTWTYSNRAWTNITAEVGNVPGIEAAACAYDQATNQIILFGGYLQEGNTTLKPSNQTWAFADDKWSRIITGQSAPRSAFGEMAYDAKDGYIVMFGGQRPHDPTGYYNDETWIYMNNTWKNMTQLNDIPTDRWEAKMVNYSDGVILFGGLLNLNKDNSTVPGHASQNQTWQFVGGKWVNITPASPLPNPPTRFGFQMAYDPVTGNILLFSGLAATAVNSPAMDDLWSFSNGNWISITNPIVFKEIGLPIPIRWTVTLSGDPSAATNLTDVFGRVNGYYEYKVAPPKGYEVSPISGLIHVDNAPVEINLTFTG